MATPPIGPATPPGTVDTSRPPQAQPDRLERLTVAAVNYAREVDEADEPAARQLRRSVEELCVEARARGLRVEQLLILLKERWHAIPGPRTSATRLDGAPRLGRLVETCIRAYFGER
jgi:hypothetical protein